MNKTAFLSVISCIFMLIALPQNSLAYEPQPEQSTAMLDKAVFSQNASATNEMVVTAHPLATEAAYKILNQGGTAADAAIAAQLVLGLVEPQSSGLGGGGFVLYYQASTNKIYSLDGRETAPKSAKENMFLDKNDKPLDFFTASTSKKSIGIPAMPELLFNLNRKFGTKELWKSSFQDAINLARNGFTVTPRLADSVEKHQDRLIKNKSITYFTKADGSAIQSGDILKNPAYKETLTNYRDIGPRFISPHYKIKHRPSLCGNYRSYTVCSMPEPSSGGLTLLQILRLIEPYDLGAAPNADAYHLYLEASKLAFADRNHYMADPDFVKTPGKLLIHPDYMAERRTLINPTVANDNVSFGIPKNWQDKIKKAHHGYEDGGTTHISIIDRYGNALSMTSSIEYAFGSGYMKDGYFLNNQLTDFSFLPEKDGLKIANRVQAGKRPRSSMSPTIIFDQNKKPIMVIGSAGGSRIIGYVAQRIIAVLDWNMSPQQAMQMPTILSRGKVIEAESNMESSIIRALESKGHQVKQGDLNSGLTMIYHDGTSYHGAADPRREGTAKGN